MLSNSQVKLFLLVGTILFSGFFLYFSIDLITAVPEQTKNQKINEVFKRGELLLDKNNCMECHTIQGESTNNIPTLIESYAIRGKPWLAVYLKDIQSKHPNNIKMVQNNFNEIQISDIISFLKQIGETNLNGIPVKPFIKKSSISDVQSLKAYVPQVFKDFCIACHSVQGVGGNVGPSLDGVSNLYETDYLKKWIYDPAAVKEDTKMPKLLLTPEQIESLLTFLQTLK